jgi:hypothetical protein
MTRCQSSKSNRAANHATEKVPDSPEEEESRDTDSVEEKEEIPGTEAGGEEENRLRKKPTIQKALSRMRSETHEVDGQQVPTDWKGHQTHCQYEMERAARIAQNNEVMSRLVQPFKIGLSDQEPSNRPPKGTRVKRKRALNVSDQDSSSESSEYVTDSDGGPSAGAGNEEERERKQWNLRRQSSETPSSTSVPAKDADREAPDSASHAANTDPASNQ